MDAKPRAYSVGESDERIKAIVNGAGNFEERAGIPASATLTHANGFYVECVAIFIDIRGSSQLREQHPQRRTLGKLYRAYVSEAVAVMNSVAWCKQVFIQGDQVSAVFDSPSTQAVQEIFPIVAMLNSMVNLLNFRLERAGITPIRCGIGIDKGRALMLKAGFSGSGINDVIWMGDVLNQASKLCHQGAKGGRDPIQVSPAVAECLDPHALSLLRRGIVETAQNGPYQGDIIFRAIEQHVAAESAKPTTSGLLGIGPPAAPSQPFWMGSTGAGGGLLAPPPIPPAPSQKTQTLAEVLYGRGLPAAGINTLAELLRKTDFKK